MSSSPILNDSKHDPEQVKLMAEECILVNEDDVARGKATKTFCHLWTNIEAGVALHRAFSVCLFNTEGKLLLQQRSAAKITFPLMWTNTCCSHPLAIDGETEESEHLGVKRAALRKLEHELGVPLGSINIDEVHYLTRILYNHKSGGTPWGEHEVDHILFIQKDVPHKMNVNEVGATKYVTPDELKHMFTEKDCPITPWFQMICNEFLFPWWAKLPTIIKDRGLGAEQARAIHRLSLRVTDETKSSGVIEATPPEVTIAVVARALEASVGSGSVCGTLPSTTSISSSAACTSTKCASLCHVTDSSKTTTVSVTNTPPPNVAVP